MTEPVTPQVSTEAPAGDPNDPQALAPNTTETPPEPQAPRGLKGSGLRYTEADGVPSWAVGKTADEVLGLSQEMFNVIQTSAPTPAPVPTPSPTPMNTHEIDPNLMYSNPTEYNRLLVESARAAARAELAAAEVSFGTPMESMAKSQAQAFEPEVWKRYAPEIEVLMRDVAPAQRRNPEVWKRAVKLVKSDHLDDLVEERARALAARGDAGSLPGSGAPPTGDPRASLSPLRKLFADKAEAVKDYIRDEISVDQVIARARQQGYTEEAYAELLTNRALRRVGA